MSELEQVRYLLDLNELHRQALSNIKSTLKQETARLEKIIQQSATALEGLEALAERARVVLGTEGALP